MRIYIIGNDGITLCREPPATVNKGEVAVASRGELHAARLSGKRLLALWNALPGVEKQTKVGDRDTLIDQLWSAIEALPDPDQPSDTKRPSKQEAVIAMLQRPEGATVDEVASVMGWQRHTVRGLFSGTLKKKLGLTLASATEERGRVYRIAPPRSRHEARDPRCNGLPGGALAPPQARPRRASAAVARSLQSGGVAVPQPRTAAASCRIPDAGGRSRRPPPGAAASAPSICSAAQRQQRGADTSSSRAEAWNSAGSRMAGSNL